MNILWITNIMLPAIAVASGRPKPAVGGWMQSSLDCLKTDGDFRIAVATVYDGQEVVDREIDGVRYFLLPLHGKPATAYNSRLEPLWRQVKESVSPDVVHIHGSEYPHGLAWVNACGSDGVVVSIQGLVSAVARYYAAGIDDRSISRCVTLRDIVRGGGIRREQERYARQGDLELQLLRKVGHVIGRTDWDHDHCRAINPRAAYHHCGETMRRPFYENRWSYAACEPRSIFVSQASYPVKGLHMLLKALPLVARRFPDVKVYVAGVDPTARPFWKITGYGLYLKRLMAELGVRERVEFTGMLGEEEMCGRYLKSNLFVCCSSIENSPNSLGEAQLLRMPHVASFVGGVPEIVSYSPEALYRFEEFEMLAEKICRVFEAGAGVAVPEADLSRYDGAENTGQLIRTYKTVYSGKR